MSDLIPLKDCGKIGEIFLKANSGAKEDTMINGIMLFYNDLVNFLKLKRFLQRLQSLLASVYFFGFLRVNFEIC